MHSTDRMALTACLMGLLSLAWALDSSHAAPDAAEDAADEGITGAVAQIAEARVALLGDLHEACDVGETTIYFGAGASEPGPADVTQISLLAECLSELAVERAVEVVGYSDPVGVASANRALAGERAQRVADLLVEQGVEPGILAVRSLGEARSGPITLRTGSRRRVEIRFVPLDGGAGYALSHMPRRLGSAASRP